MLRAARPIRIFTPSFADDAGTNAQNLTVKEVVARLDPARFHVTMFTIGAPDPRIAARPNTRLRRWGARGNTLRTMLHLLTDVPDVCYFPREGPLDDKFFSMRRHLRWHTAVVTYIVSGGLERFGPRPGQLRNLRQATAVYGNNGYITNLIRQMGFEAETIYDGVDRRYFFPAEIGRAGGKAPRALFAGSFRTYKRADIVVQLAGRWPGVDFCLAGVGEEQESCRQLAAKLGCRNVQFLGHLAQQQLGEEMRCADIFVFPSEVEGHPQVLLQAAACGLPCVAMSSYHPDVVVNGETGFLADGEEDFAEKFARLVQDSSMRAAMSKAAALHAARFDWDLAASQWAEAFERVMERKV